MKLRRREALKLLAATAGLAVRPPLAALADLGGPTRLEQRGSMEPTTSTATAPND